MFVFSAFLQISVLNCIASWLFIDVLTSFGVRASRQFVNIAKFYSFPAVGYKIAEGFHCAATVFGLAHFFGCASFLSTLNTMFPLMRLEYHFPKDLVSLDDAVD